jgi:hypothetical protein
MENKRAHLGMIQGVINRMGSNSFLLKGWTITLVAALFALAMKESSPRLMYVAYFPAVIFWALDGYYLWQERLFRKLYERVRITDEGSIDFSMNTSVVVGDTESLFRTVVSQTLAVFYGVVILAIFLLFILSERGK